MHTKLNYSQEINVSSNAKQTFYALTEYLHLWWGKTSHSSFKKDGQFTITFENGYWWTFKIIAYKPSTKLSWLCTDGQPEFNREWIGNTLHWRIKENSDSTTISFLHEGLTPKSDCYDICAPTWDRFITKELIAFLSTL